MIFPTKMCSTSSLLYPLTLKFKLSSSPKVCDPLNPDSLLRFRTRKPSFPGVFLAEKTGVRDPTRTMIKTSVLKDSRNGDEGLQVLEQEAFISRPVQLQGLEPTLNRLSKWLLSALFGGVILWRHDAEALWMAMGSIVNALLSIGLKQVFNQERPVAGLKSDPGMPSSHAQSIFFTVVFAIASILEWQGVNELSVSISLLALAFGSYFSWLRVSQQLHTTNQILVGAVTGSIFSILWYMSWDAVVLEAFNSSLLVKVILLLASAGFGIGFLLYVIQNWLKDEK
ncbi:hypothetical protein PTKIN_Ptkin08bG0187300 [Pterospermum kingtungense]